MLQGCTPQQIALGAARRAIVAALLLVTSHAYARADADALWEHPWIEVRSPHFVVYSERGQANTEALVQTLEHFRSGVELLTNIQEFEDRVPTRVYALAGRSLDLGLSSNLLGYFQQTMRGNYIALAGTSGFDEIAVKHEYVHYLVHNRDDRIYPTWFDEGFADYLSTLDVQPAAITYGAPPHARVEDLIDAEWLPFDELLSKVGTFDFNPRLDATFYAQSWFLVHYLLLGHGAADFAQQNTHYLNLMAGGAASPRAFAEAFGIEPSQLRIRLLAYRQHIHSLQLPLRQPMALVPCTTRVMRRDEVAAALGILAIETDHAVASVAYYKAALRENPNNADALVGVAESYKRARDWPAARAMYEKAVAIDPQDANHEVDFGEYYLEMATRAKSPAEAADLRVEARRHFARGYVVNAHHPELLAQNGASYLEPGEDPTKALPSLQSAARMLPANTDIRVLLGRALVINGRIAEGRHELVRVLVRMPRAQREAIQKLLDAHPAPKQGSDTQPR